MRILKVKESDLLRMRKSDPKKQAIAWLLKTKTSARNEWIADRLCMGHWTSVTQSVIRMRNEKERKIKTMIKKFEEIL